MTDAPATRASNLLASDRQTLLTTVRALALSDRSEPRWS
jgi:hypothetical protein